MGLLKVCLVCGELSDRTKCEQHRPPTPHKTPREQRGYDYQWQKLSRRARRLQPFCTDCGTSEDLTADHSREAWERKAKGLPIRLTDIAVRCRSCNAKKGAAR